MQPKSVKTLFIQETLTDHTDILVKTREFKQIKNNKKFLLKPIKMLTARKMACIIRLENKEMLECSLK